MLTSNLVLGTIFFACFSIFSMFYGIFMTQVKLGDTSHYNFLTKDDSPWFEPQAKVIFFIVDGLRFDYLLNYENVDHNEKLKENKLKKFNQAFYKNPEQFVVLRARADIPTMTVMRVPCLMTGNVPIKAHIMTSFGALSAMEDSILRQVDQSGKRTYFSGDPVLKEYFPEYLTNGGGKIKGFNIRDDTIDIPTHKFIREKIKDDDYGFLLSHLLAIDHQGHIHSLSDKRIPGAMDDVDQFLVDVINAIDDDTILVFGGDHGMTAEGTHGGSSAAETNTAIVAYHKKGFMKYKKRNPEINKVMRSINDTDNQVRQVDIVPTLSMLMGLPIPFSSMGQVLNDLYPVTKSYSVNETCPDSAFEMQMLHDNHLNTLQILNYFFKHEKATLAASKKEIHHVKKLAKEVEEAYKVAQHMIDNSQQCQNAFHKAAANAILKSQELSTEVYKVVSTKVPFEMAVFYQGLVLLLIVAISYILIIQFIYKTKDYEHVTLTSTAPKNWKAVIKFFAPIIVISAIAFTLTLYYNARMMRPITISIFALGVWVFGSSIAYFFFKPQENLDQTPSTNEEDKTSTPNFSFKSLFIFQSPRISAAAVGIFGYLFYLVHAFNLDKEKLDKRRYIYPYIIVLLIAARISGRYLNIWKYIMGAATVLCVGLHFVHVVPFMTQKVKLTLGLVFMADWLWNEAKFAQKKLKASKLWSYQYIIGFGVLAAYHITPNRESEFTQITLPRTFWALSLGSFLTSLALKMPRKIVKRNMQAYLVLFMALLQDPKRIIYFGMILSMMRVANFIFKRMSFKNYLYPLVIGFIGYMGVFMLNFTDRRFPNSFAPAFVGLRDFNIVFSLLFFAIAIMSSVILGILFLSYHDKTVGSEHVELGASKGDTSMETYVVKEYSTMIKKRNLILYGFFYNLIMLSASAKILIYRNTDLDEEGVMEKFFMDAAFYVVIMITIYFML